MPPRGGRKIVSKKKAAVPRQRRNAGSKKKAGTRAGRAGTKKGKAKGKLGSKKKVPATKTGDEAKKPEPEEELKEEEPALDPEKEKQQQQDIKELLALKVDPKPKQDEVEHLFPKEAAEALKGWRGKHSSVQQVDRGRIVKESRSTFEALDVEGRGILPPSTVLSFHRQLHSCSISLDSVKAIIKDAGACTQQNFVPLMEHITVTCIRLSSFEWDFRALDPMDSGTLQATGAKLIWENKLSVREPPFEVYSTAKRYVPRAANEAQKDLEVEELEFGRQEVQSQVVTVPNTHEYHPIERTVF